MPDSALSPELKEARAYLRRAIKEKRHAKLAYEEKCFALAQAIKTVQAVLRNRTKPTEVLA